MKSKIDMGFLKNSFFLLLLFVLSAGDVFSQSTGYLGTEVQVYPAGIILDVRGGVDLGAQQEINFRAGYNITDRQDFGKHDNEEGSGPGFGLGYRYYLSNSLEGFFVGARTDLWFIEIDWTDRRTICGTVPPCFETDVEGKTEIIVLQPTAEVGYDILKNNVTWSLAPTISLGAEINIQTEGEPVGEGAILLGGLNVSYSF